MSKKTDSPASKKLGLVLGGGGARGFAHVGVLKALEEAGIKPPIVAGTSMGGIMGGMYAAGYTPDEMQREVLNMIAIPALLQLIDWSPAKIGLQAGGAVTRYLTDKFGADTQLNQKSDENLPLLGVVTVDMESGEEIALTGGNMVEALRATSAVPGVFDPVVINARYFVDGGILNNVPVDVARQLGADVIVAVDVGAWRYDTKLINDSRAHKGQRLTHTVDRMQAIITDAMFEARYGDNPPDVMLRPDIPSKLSLFTGLVHVPEAIAAGEQAVRNALPAIKNALGLD